MGDFNGDGKQDLAATNQQNQTFSNVSVLLRGCGPIPTPTATATVVPSPTPTATATAAGTPALIKVFLPIDTFSTSVPTTTVIIEPVTTTLIDNSTTQGTNLVGFQGDFTFDSAVIGFATSGVNAPPVQRAGLTSDPNWNVSSNVLPGPGPTPGTLRILRVSAFMANFVPLNGFGTLFELRPFRVSSTCGATSPLVWRADPDNFFYIDDNLDIHTPDQNNGLITITCSGPATPTATATATATAMSTATATAAGTPTTPTPTPVSSCAPISEGFDNITTLPGAGWVQTNHSTTVGTTNWFQGNSAVFPAQSGAADSYIGANFNNTTGTNTISNWLLTPARFMQNGASITFWTRTVDAPLFPDRLQVRMSTNGMSSNVGTTATDVGDFTTLLLDINPTYTTSGYPNVWTQYTLIVSGVPSSNFIGRIAFRYFVENGGPKGDNSDYIGIDSFQFNAACGPTPTPTGTVAATPTATATATATATVAPSASPTGTPCCSGGFKREL